MHLLSKSRYIRISTMKAIPSPANFDFIFKIRNIDYFRRKMPTIWMKVVRYHKTWAMMFFQIITNNRTITGTRIDPFRVSSSVLTEMIVGLSFLYEDRTVLAQTIITSWVKVLTGIPNARARPKSASFKALVRRSIKRFWGFRSRWRTLCAWQ
jgi:hypothetical protein